MVWSNYKCDFQVGGLLKESDETKSIFYSIECDSSAVPKCVTTANPIFPAETVAPLACEGLLNKESVGKSRKVEEGEVYF